jgi:hypothetical protein
MGKSLGRKKKRNRRKTRSASKPVIRVKLFGRVYSNSCYFCNAMKEEWEKLTNAIHRTKQGVILKDIGENYDENIQILNKEYTVKLEANGLPTIFRIMQNVADNRYSLEYYHGERTSISMMKWLNS